MEVSNRQESYQDYSAIAAINYAAFLKWRPDNPFVSEPLVVTLARQVSGFTPELSLVALAEGRIVGHILHLPFDFIVNGSMQHGAVLGPVAVLPELHGRGIGAALVKAGDAQAQRLGCSFSILCGHPTYYPKLGYRQLMFSVSGVKVQLKRRMLDMAKLVERPLQSQDMDWLSSAWRAQNQHATLALYPGNGVMDWYNASPINRAMVVMRDNEVLGYVRYAAQKPDMVKEVVAVNKEALAVLCEYLFRRAEIMNCEWLHLPLTPQQIADCDMEGQLMVEDERAALDAFMLKVLDNKNEAVSRYCSGVSGGTLQAGIIAFPTVYDVEEGSH